ncbi:uncharacterized protein LOC132722617 [Ruditapes philippinarum]|uniref:uncharacterized protein LOC132722617 n=1 Tax=Ruditapes philippinarum TaxID=129788 RepID=UPI00295BE9D3|nr:uncharacterized protein LOC132722617 [Ruditapes philippinarum]
MEEIRKKLNQFPSSFSVTETMATMSRVEIEKVKHKLEIELESSEKEFSTDMEKIRAENLLSFLQFHLGDQEKATQFNETVLDREPDNMIALSNKAWFSLRNRKHILQCKELCDRLKALTRQNELAFVIARAEVAFTYSRLGIWNYKKASLEFENVLRDSKKMKEKEFGLDSASHSTLVQVPADYVCVWMYGKALCQRRQSHLYNMYDVADMEEMKNYYNVTLELYMNIIGIENSESDCIKRYKARSYVEIGRISYDVTKKSSVFTNGMEEFMPSNSPFLMPTTDYFRKALEYYPDDVYVLERSGKFFRYINQPEESIHLLTRAIEIKPTSFGYHHIALTFKRLLEINKGGLARQLLERHKDCTNGQIKSFGERNDVDGPEGNPTNRSSRSLHRNEIQQNYIVGEDKSQDQMLEAHRSVTTALETAMQSLNKRRRDMQQSSFTLTGNFSQLDLNPQRGNVNSFPVDKQYFPRRAQLPLHRDQRHVRRPNNLYFRKRGTDIPDGPSRLNSKSGIKCPKQPKIIDYNKHKSVVDKIIVYLDTSFEMSTNTNAIYDKALLYRQISQPKTALKILEDLSKNNDKFNTPIMLANIYEQSAFCISEMLHQNNDFKMNEKCELEAARDLYLNSSIEISCGIIEKIPYLDNCWKSAATLRNVLYGKLETERTKNTLKDLSSLNEKLNRYRDAVEVLKELELLADDTEEERENTERIVNNHFLAGNFEEAVIALCMSKQLRDGQPIVEKDLYIKVYIEAGLDAFRQKHYQKGKMRIGEAFRFVREQTHKNSEASDMDEEENASFDLFILSNLDDEDNGRKLMMILDNFGLKATFNTDSPAIAPGTPEVTGMTDTMNKSNAFVGLKDFDTDNKQMQHIIDRMQSIVENRHTKTLVLVVTLPESTEVKPGSFYATQRKITIDLKSVPEDSYFTVEHCLSEGVKSLLVALASV